MAKSPTLYKQIKYNEKEIWKEVDRVVAEDKKRKFSPGQNLYYNIPLFANPQYFLDQESQMYINEYNEELEACEMRKREMNNG